MWTGKFTFARYGIYEVMTSASYLADAKSQIYIGLLALLVFICTGGYNSNILVLMFLIM